VSSGSFKDKYPTGKIKLNIDVADLEKLNLHAGPMKIRGVLDADIQSVDLDYLNGKFSFTHLTIAEKRAIYYGFHYYDRYFSRQKHAVF
jgi:hypothetical protein